MDRSKLTRNLFRRIKPRLIVVRMQLGKGIQRVFIGLIFRIKALPRTLKADLWFRPLKAAVDGLLRAS